MEAPRQRLFLGIALAANAREALAASLRAHPLGPLAAAGVPPAAWHVTLVFLGATTAGRRDAVLAALRAASLGPPFALATAGLAAFPQPAAAHVLWLGFGAGRAALQALQARASAAVAAAGGQPERRPFTAHLSLARLAPPLDLTALLAAPPPAPVTLAVDRVVLFLSRHGGGGAAANGESGARGDPEGARAAYDEVAAVPLV